MNKLHIMSQDGSKIIPYGAINIKEKGFITTKYQIIVQYFIGSDYMFSNVGEFRSKFAAKEVIKEIGNLMGGGPTLIINKDSGIDGKTINKVLNTSVVMTSSNVSNSVRQLDGDRVYKIPRERDYSGKI